MTEDVLVMLPDELSFVQAAPLMCAGASIGRTSLRTTKLTAIIISGNRLERHQAMPS
jgi:D-arabinose 1-dehydrogenase-like Zn-dependent alcohol dehydrogenase